MGARRSLEVRVERDQCLHPFVAGPGRAMGISAQLGTVFSKVFEGEDGARSGCRCVSGQLAKKRPLLEIATSSEPSGAPRSWCKG